MAACAASQPAAAQVCGAAGGDNRPDQSACVAQDDASDPANPRADAAVSATAASIDLVTGNKYLQATDARWPGGLVFMRHYNSRNGFARSLGAGWSHGWETQLLRRSAAEIQILQGDGRRRVFVRRLSDADAIRYISQDPLAGEIIEHDSTMGLPRYRWRMPDGLRLSFNDDGRLLALESVQGVRIRLEYAASTGWLRSIHADTGAVLRLTYDQRGRLVSLQHPDGRLTRYEYQEHGLLARVETDAGVEHRYDYAAQSLLHGLTRISDRTGATVGEFSYDDQGRAIASRSGSQPGVRIAYRLPLRAGEQGETQVLHERDGQTRYWWRYRAHEQVAQMLDADGPGCEICPPTGLSRRYDAAGRVIAEHDRRRGMSLLWRRDALGRVIRLDSRWLARSGEAPVSRYRRFEYAGSGADAPVRAWHEGSIAPGRERSVRWQHDDQGRVLSRTLSGYAPEFQGVGPELTIRRWRPITQSVHFGYLAEGAARGRLAWIDGPLPGSQDRTAFQYDQQGRLTKRLLPEGLSESFEYDHHGRRVAWRDVNGTLLRYRYGEDAMLQALERNGAVSTWSDGPAGKHWLRTAGRTILGIQTDSAGHPLAILDPAGQRIDWPSRSSGIPAESEVRGPSDSSWPAGQDLQQPTDPLGARRLEWRDDFGRLVAQAHPQQGLTLFRYDAAGRLESRMNESGAHEFYRHDSAGRLLNKGSATYPMAVQYRWQGWQLVGVSDPVQTLVYTFDADGRQQASAALIGPRDQLDRLPARPLVSVFVRDESGQMVAERLPDGHALGFARDSQGRLSAIALHSADGQRIVLASDIRWQADRAAVSLSQYRAPSGLSFHLTHDPLGRLAQIELRRSGVLEHRQLFSRDALGRLTGIHRNGRALAYAYDEEGRLEGWADGYRAEGFAYDANGNRLVRLLRRPGAADRIERSSYDREGRLLRVTSREGQAIAQRLLLRSVDGRWGLEHQGSSLALPPAGPGSAWPNDLPTKAAWQATSQRGVLRGFHGRAVADFSQGRILAVHDYDARGLRVRRSVGKSPEHSELFLHREGALIGVADHQGNLRRWIVRLGQWPLAELTFEQGRLLAVQWLLPDQRGAPLRSYDQKGELTWEADFGPFGELLSSRSHRGGPVGQDPQLRMAGQWSDPHGDRYENGWRSYIPHEGRYAQPDPLGPRGSANSRAYAAGDPVGRIDPLGLYEIDVHYYLTYFLARTAGVTPQRAHTVALAAQYVDDNPQTRPETAANSRARSLYHFVMSGHDRSRDPATRYFNPVSPQLSNLYRASQNRSASECARLLFLGEYLHTFEDSFSHRDADNVPFAALQGHLLAGHDPDQTYNVRNSAAPAGSWLHRFDDYLWNENRSMRMAQETYGVLQAYFGTSPAASFERIEPVVHEFLLTGSEQYAAWIAQADRPETSGEYTLRKMRELSDKIAVLDEALTELELGSFYAQYADAQGNTYQAVYRSDRGANNRREYLAGLRHGPDPATDPFRGVLLPGD